MRRFPIIFEAITVLAVAAWGGAPAAAGEELAGPVAAELVRVIDGDSIEVRARLWIGLDLTIQVRIRGIDAPETGGRAGCAAERQMAAAARDRLSALAAGPLLLANITPDKYGGRVDADVTNAAGIDLQTAMLASGLARAYDGAARGEWCDLARLGG